MVPRASTDRDTRRASDDLPRLRDDVPHRKVVPREGQGDRFGLAWGEVDAVEAF